MNEVQKRLLAMFRAGKDDLNETDTKMLSDLEELEAKEKASQPSIESIEQSAVDLHNEVQRKALKGEKATDESMVNQMTKAFELFEIQAKEMRKEIADLRNGADQVPQEQPGRNKGAAVYTAKAMERIIVTPTKNEDIKYIQEVNDDLVIAATMMSMCSTDDDKRKSSNQAYISALNSLKNHDHFAHKIAQIPDARIKTLYSTGSSSGDEWVPTALSTQMIEMVNQLAGLDTKFDLIDMPTNPFDIPAATSHSTVSILAEPTTDSDTKIVNSNPGTGKVTLTTKTLGFRNDWTEEMDEDSIIAMLPFLKRDGAMSISVGLEDAIINGDTTSPHMDTDTTTSTDVRKAWKGLRKLANDRSAYDVALGTYNAETLRNLRKEMGKYGVNPKMLMYIMGIIGYTKTLSIKDSSGNAIVQTFDKFGSNATWLTGFLSSIDGAPLVVSEKVRENLNATGTYDGSTTDNGIILCAYRPGFVQGERRKLTMKVVEKPEYDKYWMIFSVRRDFQPRYGTSDNIVAGGINLDCS